ncbi:conserved unknown protein [Ectocarpus siliculosus]|uniref:Uncharacterized protein n=1 Tax=Ectocarpus siliculosus TaxID=2880 RepID=D8LQ42_ECTSI|nr:conserved unknown protein [Ectocarpus siliculosus]|eukprot:CBN77422.1 conserved unknown protein [Ectocarpus siliculosus]
MTVRSAALVAAAAVAGGFVAAQSNTTATSSTGTTFAAIAGYTPVSDVVEHSELDLDVAEIEAGADLLSEAGFATAYTAYSVGGNSEKTDSTRTVQGFSTGAQEKLTGEVTFDIWEAFWGSPDYADQYTSGACLGTGTFAGASNLTRSECCLKGAQYQNIWMYVTHELYDAVGDCENGDLSANDGGPHAWDEGWAFYAGSLEGTDVGGTGDGQMLYALAEKRCENFGTCTGDSDGSDTTGVSAINSELLTLWETGQASLLAEECTEASAVIDQILPLMAVPLIQGLLRYTYLADPAIGTGGDKEAAELWAFSASILPWISTCDAAVGTKVRDNTELGSASAPMADGYAAIKAELETVYSCMGITCAQVGGLLDDTGAYYADFEPCVDADASTTSVTSATGTYANIAGYEPGSDVVEHSELDLDVADMEAGTDLESEAGLTAAYTAYSEGGNSEKTDSTRTLQGLSTDAQEKLTGEATFDVWEAYWGSPDYADQYTSAACQGTGTFEGAEMVTRSECCLKGAQYQNVWMYVTHELYDAVGDCENGDLSANDGGPHAWDEGWAFYTGSLEGTAVGGTGDGQMLYALAEKRCENFGTCTGDSDGSDTTGVSAINSELLGLWEDGKANLLAEQCTQASAVIDQIVPLMAVPLIQGLLRYTYLADPAIGTGGDKEAAELWAFSASILPWISACDAAVGTTVRDNTELGSASAPMADGYAAIKTQLETVYSCMGITCAQVGGLLDDTGAYYTDFEPCDDSTSTTDSATSATGTYADIAGYTPGSDVVEHSELDLDVADMEAGTDLESEAGLTAAYTAYSEGGNSEKTDSTRTLQGLSTDADGKLTGEATFDVWEAYWGSPDYADQYTSAACQGTGTFEGAEMVTRSECCLKGAQYQNVWMYVTHELYDAVGDCENGDLSANDGGPHAWDEGWAFYTGSLEGTAVGGTGDGQMLYALAEKRCENFGTCTGDSDGSDTTGVSAINSELLGLWEDGKANLLAEQCTQASAVIDQIVPLMAVPLIQGLLRYTYLADPAIGTGGDKEAAELWAFSASILPWISACDAAVGTTVRDNTELGSASAPMADGYAAIKTQLETVYSCMGITCAQVGGLLDDTGAYYTDFEPCDDSTSTTDSATSATGTYADIAGYTPGSDVVEHSELDLDVADMEAGTDLESEAGLTAAYTAYSEGGNSEKTDSTRTLQGLSTDADGKLTGEATFDVWEAYWGSPDYADQYTSAACQGTGTFEGAEMVTRSECCLKGAQYQNVWMYVTHELYDAVVDCENGDLSANDGGPHAWDEGWAFYAGSLEGTDAGGSGDGQMIYALAEKRCENFGTCSGDTDGSDATGVSAINSELLTLWEVGKANLLAEECTEASAVIDQIVPLMAVPLIQGLLRYTYLADPAIGTGGDKEAAELWAFSASILPWISACDAAVGTAVRDNTELGSASAPMADGYAAIKTQLETVYSCMGITCAQVGGLLDDTGAYYTDFEPCDDGSLASIDRSSDSGLDDGGIAGVTIGVIAAAAIGVAAVVLFKKRRKGAATVNENLGNF